MPRDLDDYADDYYECRCPTCGKKGFTDTPGYECLFCGWNSEEDDED